MKRLYKKGLKADNTDAFICYIGKQKLTECANACSLVTIYWLSI